MISLYQMDQYSCVREAAFATYSSEKSRLTRRTERRRAVAETEEAFVALVKLNWPRSWSHCCTRIAFASSNVSQAALWFVVCIPEKISTPQRRQVHVALTANSCMYGGGAPAVAFVQLPKWKSA